MKVLWLTPVQLPAAKGRDATSGGWMEGLRRALEACEPEVELTIASCGGVHHDPFREGNAEYLCIAAGSATPRGRLARLHGRWAVEPVPPGALADCRRIIARVGPDLIHVHGSESFLGLALAGSAVPSVLSLQGIVHAIWRQAAAGLGAADLLRLSMTRDFLHGYGLLHDLRRYRVRARTELKILTLCDAYLGRTAWDRGVLRAVRPDARYYRSDEILQPVFYGQRWEDPGPAAPIFCTSGASPFKGLETLLDAVAALQGTSAEPVRLRVAGAVRGGALWPLLKRRLADSRLRGRVDLLGVLDPPAILAELRAASVYVQPSHADNSPNALCEAMLVGLPCVASRVGGIPSLIEDGQSGLLCPDREPRMLAQAIGRLLVDRGQAARLGAGAHEAARVRHDPERAAHAVAQVYREEIRRGAHASE
ncbi:MAG: glycosyltransferase family 4 protein [Thermoleophilia bacterium]